MSSPKAQLRHLRACRYYFVFFKICPLSVVMLTLKGHCQAINYTWKSSSLSGLINWCLPVLKWYQNDDQK